MLVLGVTAAVALVLIFSRGPQPPGAQLLPVIATPTATSQSHVP
jgi:hypothetical protein